MVEIDSFRGKDADNMRILEFSYRQLFPLWFRGLEAVSHRILMERLHTLSLAWRDGCFELGRYYADEPTDTRQHS